MAVGLALLQHALLLYRELPAFPAIAQPLRALLTQHLAACNLPLELQVRLPALGQASKGTILAKLGG